MWICRPSLDAPCCPDTAWENAGLQADTLSLGAIRAVMVLSPLGVPSPTSEGERRVDHPLVDTVGLITVVQDYVCILGGTVLAPKGAGKPL